MARDVATLRRLLAPRSIAIVGASPDNSSSRYILTGLERMGFAGEVIAVNPNRSTVLGAPCVASIKDIPSPPDMAVVLLPARVVPATLASLADIGCTAAHVLAAGGSNQDKAALNDVVASRGIILLGPNCNGFVNVGRRVYGWSGPFWRPLRPGALAVVGQSGAVMGSFVHSAWDRGLGLSYVVSTGDEVSVSTPDVLKFLATDQDTRVIICYLESLQKFTELAEAVAACRAKNIPVIAIAPMNSEAARRVALSHTGSITPAPAISAAALEELGIIRAGTIDEALDYASLFAQLPRSAWRRVERVGVISVSGGWATILSELLSQHKVELPPLPDTIAAILPSTLAPNNPLDLTGIRQLGAAYPRIVEAFFQHDGFDAVAVLVGAWEGSEQWFAPIWAFAAAASKPVFLAGNEIMALGDDIRRLFERNPLPVVQGAERVARALSGLRQMLPIIGAGAGQAAQPVAEKARAEAPADWRGARTAMLLDLLEPLGQHGLRIAPTNPLDEHGNQAGNPIPFPLVMKIESADLPHKTDAGAVRMPLNDDTAYRRTYAELRALAEKLKLPQWQIIVQPLIKPDLEILVGAVVDRAVGAVITLGLGGVWAELWDRKAHALCPISPEKANNLISRLGIDPLLDGYRGAAKLDRAGLAHAIQAVGDFAHAHRRQLLELDLNPIIVTAGGCYAVDALASFDHVG